MNYLDFNKVLEKRITDLRETLSIKSSEYSTNDDKLENFKEVSGMTHLSPEMCLWGMVSKHIIALQKFIYNIDQNEVSYKQWQEKLGDIIAYMVLLDALIQERGIKDDSD